MRRWIVRIGLLVVVVWIAAAALVRHIPVREAYLWGVTFSAPYAQKFSGIQWKEAYTAMLDDLGVRHLRLVAYWDEIEPTRGTFDFSDLDWQISQARERGAKVILAVGRKLPRWPECHIPSWAQGLETAVQDKAILSFIRTTIEHYRSEPSITAWQVENEPFLDFGECPKFDAVYLDLAIALVRSLDDRPVIITDSGEWSLWLQALRRADIFGTTMYRTVWSKAVGTFTYPLPPSFFRLKRAVAEYIVGKKPMIVIELQAEPWGHKEAYETTVVEQSASMDPGKFSSAVAYAQRSGFDTFYLWGVEWWYWLKETQNDPGMWDAARPLFSKTSP